jgi:hypothetical protein
MAITDNDILPWKDWLDNHPKKDGKSMDDLEAEYSRIIAKKRANLGLPAPKAPAQPPAPVEPAPTQLPIWAEPLRAIPNEIVRSALFNAKNHRTERRYMKREIICAMGDAEITYTGQELRQNDETVWLQVLHLARLTSLGTTLRVKRLPFLKSIDWGWDKSSYEQLHACLDRLSATNLEIKSSRLKRSVGVSLVRKYRLNDITKEMQIEVEPEIQALFSGNHYTLSDWEQRLALPNGIATWLHAYYASHSDPYPIKLETIARHAGVQFSRKNDLLRAVKKAHDELVIAGSLLKYSIDGDLVTVVRAKYLAG